MKLKNDKASLIIRNLKIDFNLKNGQILHAVDGVDLSIQSGEICGLVGESGCGKSVTVLSTLRLISPPGQIVSGEIFWSGQKIMDLDSSGIRAIRGKEIAMIFQDPQAALNPTFTIGDQMQSILRVHRPMSKKKALQEVLELLKIVKMPDPEKQINSYPHQLSGGMCQRVMIAIAISCRPKLLIADEPTASLDVTIQSQILELLLEIRDKYGMAILLISHDMGVVAKMCDRISVMYLGRVIEEADAKQLYSRPLHPYTQALLKSVLTPSPSANKGFYVIKGDLPSAIDIPLGCRFRNRCPEAFAKCATKDPLLMPLSSGGSKVACWLYEQEAK